jgi:hypothetical protein
MQTVGCGEGGLLFGGMQRLGSTVLSHERAIRLAEYNRKRDQISRISTLMDSHL